MFVAFLLSPRVGAYFVNTTVMGEICKKLSGNLSLNSSIIEYGFISNNKIKNI